MLSRFTCAFTSSAVGGAGTEAIFGGRAAVAVLETFASETALVSIWRRHRDFAIKSVRKKAHITAKHNLSHNETPQLITNSLCETCFVN